MIVNLKIEILKVFILEFSFSSDKKKEETIVQEDNDTDRVDVPSNAGKS